MTIKNPQADHKLIKDQPLPKVSKNNFLSKIRYAEEVDKPELIEQFLNMHEQHSFGSCDNHIRFLQFQFDLLFDTIKDTQLPKSWRYLCLGSINRPLSSLHKLAGCIQSRQYVTMLSQQVRLVSDEMGISH